MICSAPTTAEVKAILVNPQKCNTLVRYNGRHSCPISTNTSQFFVWLSCVKFYADLLYDFWNISPFLNTW
jgi:hypothetical protein